MNIVLKLVDLFKLGINKPQALAGKMACELAKRWIESTMIMVLILFLLFCLGYICNGFWGYQFDLNTIWTGLGAISAASITGLGKYFLDSKYNTKDGEKPE